LRCRSIRASRAIAILPSADCNAGFSRKFQLDGSRVSICHGTASDYREYSSQPRSESSQVHFGLRQCRSSGSEHASRRRGPNTFHLMAAMPNVGEWLTADVNLICVYDLKRTNFPGQARRAVSCCILSSASLGKAKTRSQEYTR
jgi:hypothetical protein